MRPVDKRWFVVIAALTVTILFAVSCATPTPQVIEKVVTKEVTKEVPVTVTVEIVKEVPVTVTVEIDPAEKVPDLIATSLHGTTRGMAYFYSKEQGGFEQITGIPYDKLGCKKCHVEADKCETCHIREAGDAPPAVVCFNCHARQKKALLALKQADVHLTSGKFTCINCHDEDEVHGDGTEYNSLQEGALRIHCTDCHTDEELPEGNTAHKVHWEDVDCAACHMNNTLVCYGCHFDTLVEKHKKVAYGPFNSWKFLGRGKDGKIVAATIMPIISKDKTFIAFAPYFDHSVRKPDPKTICKECHESEIVKEYEEKGTMTVTWWDENEGKLKYYQGVIPIPKDYQEAMKFAFATITGWTEGKEPKPVWEFAKDGVDLWQMMYLEPLEELPEPLTE